jgi:DNA replication and repair protein RecF
LVSHGSPIIEKRADFALQLNEIIAKIHERLSAGKEKLSVYYEPNVLASTFYEKIESNFEKDMKSKMTTYGPHRDDFVFMINDIDLRKFGSQGQQRTAALSLKLAEIELMKQLTNQNPILLLDDVLSELDGNRQNDLLNSIGDIQTIITCTGLEDFINHQFPIHRSFEVVNGTVRT